jgi:hypothetical protein
VVDADGLKVATAANALKLGWLQRADRFGLEGEFALFHRELLALCVEVVGGLTTDDTANV